MDLTALDLLDAPWALADRDLRVRFMNATALRWLGLATAPVNLTEALPDLASPAVQKKLAAGRRPSIETTATIGGRKTPVEFRLRTVDIDGETLLVLEGFDHSKAHARQVMLEQFSQTIEANNRQLARQRADLRASNAQMRLVLDNIDQGLFIANADGTLCDVQSAAIKSWIGEPTEHERIWTYLGRFAAEVSIGFRMGFEELERGEMLAELTLDQMPKAVRMGERLFEFSCQLVRCPGVSDRVLVVVTDITARVERERAESAQRDVLSAVDRALRDRAGFVAFIGDAHALVAAATNDATDLDTLTRTLHTLKGNCAVFGVHSVELLCHELEGRVLDEGALGPAGRAALSECWSAFHGRVAGLFSTNVLDSKIELFREEYVGFLAAINARAPHASLCRAVEGWDGEPTRPHLQRLAEQAARLAERLDKGPIAVEVVDNRVRMDRGRLGRFWSELIHVVRNALDHGFETIPERASSGKPLSGCLLLETTVVANRFFIVTVGDDGRGIDWTRVAQKARERGLPAATPQQLVAALFTQGVTTRDVVTEISGRGAGLAAVRHACEEIGGHIEVESELGRGTTMRFVLPFDEVELAPLDLRSA